MVEENILISKLRELLAKDFVHRKTIESELYKSEEKYRQLIEQLTDAIYLTSVDGRFLEFNRSTCVLLGYTDDELRHLEVHEIYAEPKDRESFTQLIREHKEIQDYEIQLRKKSGEKIDCLVSSSIRRTFDGEIVGYQGIIRDITFKKKAEALEREKDLSDKANQFKAEFLANMSHEIRTPMNAIVGMAELLNKTELTDKQKSFLNAINISSENLLQIINDILDFSKIEAGKLEIEEKDFELKNLIDDLIKTIRFKADEKGIQLKVLIDENIPKQILGDPLRLNQILINLVSNAIKFTHTGEIKLMVILIDQQQDKARISFSVKDTGIGIATEKLNAIFESFTQASLDTSRLYGGTGLGLTIVKKLIDMLNGAIMVKSKLGEGSEFLFEIDFKIPKEENIILKNIIDEPVFIDIGTCKILLVEDHPINQLVTTEMLKNIWKDVQIQSADNGKIALEKLKLQDFDLILMDVQMPEMDGHTATKIIRNVFPEPKSKTPILAFTAYATTGEADKCIEAGMDDYISKPVDSNTLKNKILSLLNYSGYLEKFGKETQIPDSVEKTKSTMHLDLRYFNSITEEDMELKIKMMRIMLDETPDELEKLRKYTDEKNWDLVRAIAHKMKSSMQFLGLKETLDNVKSVELYAKEMKNLELIPEKVSRVEQDCRQALIALQEELEKIQ